MQERELDVVIRIPERTFKRIQALARDGYFEHDLCGNSMCRIANGIPLPEEETRKVEVAVEIPEEVYKRQAWLINKTEADKER